MNALTEALTGHRDSGRKILIPFLTGCFPDRETFIELLLAAQEAGADAVEVGIPFSDPSADGPVIQETSRLALRGGAKLSGIFNAVSKARARGLKIPLVYMTYYNPVLAFGPEKFAREAVDSGAQGALIVDLPPEEYGEFAHHAADNGLATVMLIAPTTGVERLPRVLANCTGFVYCVSVTGVTGVKTPVREIVAQMVKDVRPHTKLPVLVGFGVGDPFTAADLAMVSDGVIVGSALLKAIGDRTGEAAVKVAKRFIGELRAALQLDSGRK